MLCKICGKPVVLTPSAEERVKKFGGKASDYIKCFPIHSECAIRERNSETIKLINRIHKP